MRKAYVKCLDCKGEFESDKVEFINIEEDFHGRDCLTFVCPKCKNNKSSLVTLKW